MSLITKPEKSRKAGGKLAARFRNANMLFVVSVLVVMTAISSAMVYTLTDAASKEYVRFYAAETADILSSHLNKEISLVRQAAASSEIIEWFADESNPEKKQAAYNKMMLYADMVQMQGLYFAVTASGNEYSVEAGTPFEDFAPYHVLSPDSKYDRWFFDAINAEFDYILKLDTVKTSDDFSIWIDHKVINNGEIVGVFSSALPFDIIFNDLFGQYDNRNVRGVVIDHQGIIQMDSSVPDAHHLLSSLAVYDASEMNHILDVKADSAFISVINTYLENPEIHFGNRLKPEVIKISDGEFRYVAIAQIPFTNWLTVTSYSSAALFSFANALPLIIAIFLLYIIYAAVSSVLARRLVFNPLGQLTGSLSAHDPDNVFGIERDDEIGELARETRNSWNLLNEESEALQKAHEYSSLMLDLTPTACALWDEHVNLIDCNKTYVRLFCLGSKQELIDFFPRLIPGHQPDGTLTRELMDTSVKKALSTESGQFTLDFMHLLPNGDELPVEVTIVRVDDGKGAYYATYLRDMREHKRMTADIIERDRLIQEAHNHTKLLLDLTPLSCTLWDKNMQIFDCNNTVVKLFGLNSKQEYKENFGKFLPAFQPDGMPTSDKMNLSIKEAVEKGQCVLEFMHLLPGGESLPVEITVVKVDDGSGAHIATYGRDLREQKRMMKEISQRDNLLQSMNQAATMLLAPEISDFDGILSRSISLMGGAVKADRVYIWKNHVHESEPCVSLMYEWLADESFKLNRELTANVSYIKHIPDWEKALSKGECINGKAKDMSSSTYNFLKASKVLSFFVSPIFVDNKFWGFVGFDDCCNERTFTENETAILRSGCLLIGNAFLRHDMMMSLQSSIVQLKALQEDLEDALTEAQTASRSKSAFLANMSHEIRTPMNSIVGFSELAIDDEGVPAKTKDYLVKIMQNSEWLLQIINDILDISKIESGKMELENIPFDLREMFNSCRTLIMPKATEKGLIMHFYAEPSVGKRLYGDPTRLRQILVNLLSNAVKFTNSGMVKMQAVVKSTTEDSVTMSFEVKDSGIGITGEKLKTIFEPFIQADSGTTRQYGGSGLGLSITKNIIEMMGGTLAVESAPGIGSKFSFELKFNAVNIDTKADSADQISYSDIKKPMFKGEVLLCEDNNMNQHVIREHLSRVGLATTVAENGKIGTDIVQHRAIKGMEQFDLIFMDIHMPVMDGMEAALKIREIAPEIPIIAMTANIMSGDMEVYKECGMTDCVGKPFTSQELWRCLMKYLTPLIDN